MNRTRLAPTPSGYLHAGNVVSFIVTAGLARRFGAGILLRIDDMDQERVRPAYIQDIFDTLHYLGIPWDEGPKDAEDFVARFSQLHRINRYREALSRLASSGAVFACACSRSTLAALSPGSAYPGTCLTKNIPLDTPGVSWRLKTAPDAYVMMNDLFQGYRRFQLPASMQYFVVRKKDGFPAYQLSSVVDDVHFGVDMVVRGEDLFDSTLAQLYLSQLLDTNAFGQTAFFHHPLVQDAEGRKLSKSAGDSSVMHFRDQGKDPRDFLSAISGTLSLEGPADTWEDIFNALSAKWGMNAG